MEWTWTKLVGFSHDPKHGSTAVQVTNRQKVSGVVYGPGAGDHFRTCLELALACYGGEREAALDQLTSIARGPSNDQLAPDDVTDLADDDVVDVTESQALVAPARWSADPSSHHQLRYWNGTAWTEYVSDNAASSLDPI
jgi:Protein of unknown function (DUF2510)